MRISLDVDGAILQRAKALAAERGEPLSRFVEDAIRQRLRAPRSFHGAFPFRPLLMHGRVLAGVDLDDRNALFEQMEGEC